MPEKFSRLIVFMYFVALISVAQTAPVPAAKTETPATDLTKEAVIIEHYQTRISFENDGTGVREVSAAFHVQAEAGVQQLAVLQFEYTSDDQAVDVDYVKVHKPNGTVIVTPSYNVQEMPADVTRSAPMYSDIHVKHVAVKGLGVGDTLEYLVRFRTLKPEVPGEFWTEYTFLKTDIIKDEQLQISIPKEKYVRVASPQIKPDVKEEAGRRIYTWKTSNLTRNDAQDKTPKREAELPSVQLTTFKNWEQVGKWYGDLQWTQLAVTPEMQAKVAELTKGLSSDDDKIRAIYDFVSLRFHYVSLSFGIGRYKPHAAEEVFSNEYGDCKDKHTLLSAMLKAAGFVSWPALMNSTRKIDPETPSPGQFNHVITVVARGEKLTWLDSTPEVAPFGVILLNLRDKEALVIPDTKPAALMKTPADLPFRHMDSFVVEGELNGEGTFTGRMEETARGDTEVLLRAGFRSVPEAKWKDLAQIISYRMGFGGEVSGVTASSPEDTSKPFHLQYDYVRKNYSDWANRRMTAPMPPFGVEASGEDEKKPSEPVLLGAPGEIVYRATVKLPAGYTLTPPKTLNIIRDFAEYHATYKLEKDTFTAERRLVIKTAEVPLAEWQDYHSFGKAIYDDTSTYIDLTNTSEASKANAGESIAQLFNKGSVQSQSGDFTGCELTFRQVLEQKPNFQAAHYSLGVCLMRTGKEEEALKEFHKEEEIAPDFTLSYMGAAWILIRHGRDDEAIQELSKYLQFAPNDRTVLLNVNKLLQNKHRYSEAALLLARALETAPESRDIRVQLGLAYLMAGEKEKGEQALAAGLGDDSDYMTLNNAAYALADANVSLETSKRYALQALEKVEAKAADTSNSDSLGLSVTNELSMIWDTVGWVYFRAGDYPNALSYIRPSWSLSQNPEVGDHLAQIYVKQGKNQLARQALELAYAAAMTKPTQKETLDNITAHYKELTGKSSPAITATTRLPNGNWTPTPTEQLSNLRRFKLDAKQYGTTSDGNGTFSIVFSPAKIEEVRFVSGDSQMSGMADKIAAASIRAEFPAGSKAQIIRQGVMKCGRTGCQMELELSGKFETALHLSTVPSSDRVP